MAPTPLRVVIEVALATALTWVLGGVYFVVGQRIQPAEAFFVQSVGQVLGFIDVGIVTWLLLLVTAQVRGRGLGWSLRGAIIAAVIGAVVNLAWVVVLSALGGGIDPRAVALGVVAGILFIVSAAISVWVVRRTMGKQAHE